jgi:arsenite methyltransferase
VVSEIYRVRRSGGRLHLADVVVQRQLSLSARSDINLWIAWIGGQRPEAELQQLTARIGLVNGKIVEPFDCFEGTSVKANLSKDLNAQGVNFLARKPLSYWESARPETWLPGA